MYSFYLTIGDNFYGFSINQNVTLKMSFSIFILILIITIVYIITFLSAMLPIKKSSKLNIINAIKNINTYKNKIKPKTLKTPKFIQKVFGQEGELALKNIKFEKSNYKTIVISITTSIILFLTISGFINNLYKNINSEKYNDYLINVDYEMTDTVINYLKENNLIDNYFVTRDINDLILLAPEDKITNTTQNMIKNNIFSFVNMYEGKYEIKSYAHNLFGKANDEILKRANLENLKENECILINSKEIQNSKYGNKIDFTKYKVRRYYFSNERK